MKAAAGPDFLFHDLRHYAATRGARIAAAADEFDPLAAWRNLLVDGW